MSTILTIFGTRPEAIKMAPVIKAIENDPALKSVVCVTAQQRQMLDQVLALFEITPDYDLDLMANNQTLANLTAKVVTGLQDVLTEVKPDLVLVHGDTTTTMAASLAAYSITSKFQWAMWKRACIPTTSTPPGRKKLTGKSPAVLPR